jgi:outer membrane protein OmpA-like peptidoglycan-associated protein
MASAVLSFALLGAATGCQASASGAAQFGGEGEANPPPPPPPPEAADGDGDGVPDGEDKCADTKEDGKPPNASDGCPVADGDGDGVSDDVDKCPAEPETKNEFEDEDGCPDKKPLAQLIGTKVVISQKIQFKKGSAAIEKDSDPILDAVAKILTDNTSIQLLEVGGHASKEGQAAANKALTQNRVNSVVAALTKRGVEKARLYAQGYGHYCSIDPGDSEESLEKNRRVEFKVLLRDSKPTEEADKRGCEEAAKAGIKPKALPAKPWEPKAATASAAAPAPAATAKEAGGLKKPSK